MNYSKPLKKQSSRETGFVMAVVVILSTALMVFSGAVLQSVQSSRDRLRSDYYVRVAREAAEAGVQRAAYCIETSGNTITWTAAKPLTPNTDCNGNAMALPSCSSPGCSRSFVLKNSMLTSSFSVTPVATTGGSSLQFTSVATLNVYNGTPTVIRTLTQTLKGSTAQSSSSSLSIGVDNACAISNGSVYCWGYNSFGSLGGNVTASAGKPVKVSGLLEGKIVTELASGRGTVCAIAKDTASAYGLYCWGDNSRGQLGTGQSNTALPYSASPVAVSMSTGLAGKTLSNIQVGNNSACVVASGDAYCWGSNDYGQLGSGTVATNSLTPRAVTKQTGVLSGRTITQLSMFNYHVCAVASGVPVCWGWNQYGQLGSGSNSTWNVVTPTLVTGLTGTTSMISAGGAHSCAAITNSSGTKQLYCWGFAANGRLGQGTNSGTIFASPQLVSNFNGSTIKSLSTGDSHTCTVTSANAVYCWGSNSYGEVGNPSLADTATPYNVSLSALGLSGKPVDLVAVSQNRSCIQAIGKNYCWGVSYDGQFDTGELTPQPVVQDPADPNIGSAQLAILTARYVSVSDLGACTLSSNTAPTDKRIFCWGYNYKGQLGVGQTFAQKNFSTRALTTTPASSSYGYTVLATGGGQFACALNASKNYCWGSNDIGEQGSNSPVSAANTQPTAVYSSGALLNKSAVKTSGWGNLTCTVAVQALYCWGGYNPPSLANNGALTTANPYELAPVPASAPLTTGVSDVSVGQYYGCAIRNGSIYCWGNNESGQVGDGTRTTRTVAVPVASSGGGTTAAAKEIWSVNTDNTIRLTTNGLCLDADTATIGANGTKVQLWGCSGGTNQRWIVRADGRIQNSQVPRCLDADPATLSSNNIALTLYDCSATRDSSQLWNVNLSNSTIQLAANGHCVSPINTLTEGTPVGHATCQSGAGDASAFNTKSFKKIATGPRTTCAVSVDNLIYCWGYNVDGQFGNGTYVSSTTPVLINGPGSGSPLEGKTIYDFSIGLGHACASANYVAYCWGYNAAGQLGNGTTIPSNLPVAVVSANGFANSSVVSISAGNRTTCGVRGGKVYCWGSNTYGQVGNGSQKSDYSPTPTPALQIAPVITY